MFEVHHGARHDTRAFTLVELLVVVMVLAILLAIAVPTFLSARTRAENREAQATARNVLTAARVLYVDSRSYDDTLDALATIEPTYTYTSVGEPSTGVAVVSVAVAENDQELGIAVRATSGTCYMIHDVAGDNAATYYGSTSTPASCTGVAALTVASETTWTS
jgi:type IV pilus assembly protein PilA